MASSSVKKKKKCLITLELVLRHVPLPVLYGIFLYMGVNVLKSIQVPKSKDLFSSTK
jgi:HCO3- transporter family